MATLITEGLAKLGGIASTDAESPLTDPLLKNIRTKLREAADLMQAYPRKSDMAFPYMDLEMSIEKIEDLDAECAE